MSNNDIRALPAELARCASLKALLISGNPQRQVPSHIVAAGTAAILAHLAKRAQPVVWGAGATGAGAAAARHAASVMASTAAREAERESASEVYALQAKMEELQCELDSCSLTQAKRFALKKELARVRAQQIRASRRS